MPRQDRVMVLSSLCRHYACPIASQNGKKYEDAVLFEGYRHQSWKNCVPICYDVARMKEEMFRKESDWASPARRSIQTLLWSRNLRMGPPISQELAPNRTYTPAETRIKFLMNRSTTIYFLTDFNTVQNRFSLMLRLGSGQYGRYRCASQSSRNSMYPL